MKLGICPICSGKTVRKRVDLTESVKGSGKKIWKMNWNERPWSIQESLLAF